ncbi:hypothetical protein L798_07145 [Zootermopsis nevadensis]|uniref:Uncharacterized protein n=2 Tax=Zootermopsis nevadensis TaxID=136037 RepID=A0A067RJR3_ZOONE|nr:hypothetical protein L798_07145 [Zootermopsis nevadensis]
MAVPSENHEMDYFATAVTTNIPCDSNTDHLDTKGGYPNGQVNGLKHLLLANGQIPSGQASRDKCSVRIIENPQFVRGGSVDSQQRKLLPVTRSHSGHLHSDQRSGAGSEEEVRLLADHHAPLLALSGEETLQHIETSHRAVAATDTSCIDTGRIEDGGGEDVGASDLELNTTQVSNLDLSFDGDVLVKEGNECSHQNQEQRNSQQHTPHHHHHQNNSSHNSHSQGKPRLHHIDCITGTTTTRSQFYPPLLQQTPSAVTAMPQAEVFH